MDVHLRLQLPADPTAPASARHALDGIAFYVEDTAMEDLRLLVSELVTNSFRHGARDGAPIDVDVRVRPDLLRVEIADRGPGFSPSDPSRRAGAEEGSGWGLFLLDRIAARWGVERPGPTRVWFELDGPTFASLEEREPHVATE